MFRNLNIMKWWDLKIKGSGLFLNNQKLCFRGFHETFAEFKPGNELDSPEQI